MKLRKTEVYILTLLLAAAVMLCGWLGAGQRFSFLARGETIRYWEDRSGQYLVFLPSYENLEDLRLQSSSPVRFGDIQLKNGDSLASLELDRPYETEGGRIITFLKSEHLPAMYINTASGSMDYIHEDKAHSEGGTLRLYAADGTLDFRGSLESLSGHGNSTFIGSEKKPYSLRLTSEGDLLGMGAAEKWILLANCYDQSHMKNKLVTDFAADLGLAYTPDSRWVDLYLNGNYAGVYLLSERNEIHRERVDLPNGQGFLVSKDKADRMQEQNIPYFSTAAGVPLRLHGGTVSQAQMKAIWQAAEDAILEGGNWENHIDLDSWARKYLVEEIFGGGDAGLYSQYFYYLEGKIFAGPVWDYDITMGINDPENTVPNMFYANRANISPWFHALYNDEKFHSRVTTLFKEECYPRLMDLIEEEIPAYEANLAGAARLDQRRWGGDFRAETARMKDYMRERAAFLADIWINGADYVEVTAVHPDVLPFYAPVYAVPRGTPLPDIPGWREADWFITESGDPFDITRPITEEMSVYAVRRTDPQPPPAEEVRVSRINYGLWIPLLTLICLFAAMFLMDILRIRRSDRHQYATKHKISP